MLTPTVALAVALALVLANAFFVASEFAIVKIRPTRLQQLAAQGRLRARTALGITGRLDAYLSANQLGITLASLGLGAIGEPAFAHLIEPWLTSLGPWSGTAAHTASVTISFATITFLHTVVGELAPKSLAIQRTEPVALWTAPPLRFFYLVTFPIIWVLNTAASICLRMIGLKPATEAEMLHSPEELRLVVQHARLEPGARRLIDRVFDYTRRVARHVMTLRRDVVVLTAGRPFEDNLQIAVANQYTRYPLVEPGNDRVLGYVHIKDVLSALASGKRPRLMREIAREPIYVHEDVTLEWLRREFQRRRVHIAIVLGRKNVVTGIVTLEDTLEEFVGEIQDEQDVDEVPPLVRSAEGGFEADGRMTLDVAARDLHLLFPGAPAEVETIGGYIVALLGAVPAPGDRIDIPGFSLVVIDVRDGRVRRLRGIPVPRPPDADGDMGPEEPTPTVV